ncbi:hypothetical protein Celaphus_00011122, partial [Cervus elaphus hippelaphus]
GGERDYSYDYDCPEKDALFPCIFKGKVRMSVHNPPRHVILAAVSLWRDEALAISSLEYLSMELYPPLFMAAFSGRNRETLKAMVQAWPFVRLPLKVPSRKCKMWVVDLRNTGQNFTSLCSGASSYGWVEQRKSSIHLWCKKLKIVSMPMDNIMKVLSMVQLDYIQEVQMSNLQRLHLFHIHMSAFKKQEQHHIVQITSQFLKLSHFQDLHLASPSFPEGCLDQML